MEDRKKIAILQKFKNELGSKLLEEIDLTDNTKILDLFPQVDWTSPIWDAVLSEKVSPDIEVSVRASLDYFDCHWTAIYRLSDPAFEKEFSFDTSLESLVKSNILKWFEDKPLSSVMHHSVREGQVEVIKWLRSQDCPWDMFTCMDAARNGHLEVLQFAIEDGCRLNRLTSKYAAENGHIHILKWARGQDCEWDEDTCASAALYGHLETLQWLRAAGCPWNERTCGSAALNGHLQVLKWALDNGCPMDEEICANAAGNGHLECLTWARGHGCPWDKWTCTKAALGGHIQILDWALENGCPFDEQACASAMKTGQWAKDNKYISRMINDLFTSSP